MSEGIKAPEVFWRIVYGVVFLAFNWRKNYVEETDISYRFYGNR